MFGNIAGKRGDAGYLEFLSVPQGPLLSWLVFSIFSFFNNVLKSHLPQIISSLPNDKSLDVTKLKAFADDKFNVAKTISLR